MNKSAHKQNLQSRVISLRFFNEKKIKQKDVASMLGISRTQVQTYEKQYKKNI